MALFDFLKRKKKQEKHEKNHAPEERVREKEPVLVEKSKLYSGTISEHFVLQTPHVTERARMLAEHGQYTFRIHPNATKRQVAESVERLYGVHVAAVQITKAHEKPRRRGLTEGVKKGYKKAVVALRKGEAIDIF